MHALRRRRALAAFAFIALGACTDATSSSLGPVAWDLLFDGENAEGVPFLYRVSLHEGGDGAIAAGAPTLVAGGISGRMPVPSPDGRTIAYESVETYEVGARLMLLARDAAPLPLEGDVLGSTRKPTWSPDGTRLAFSSSRDELFTDIFVGGLSGGRLGGIANVTRTAPGGGGSDLTPAWSPNGEWIAFSGYRSHPAIWVMRPDGRDARRVTDDGTQHGDYSPTWSPDGRHIAFHRNSPSGTRIGIVPLTGGAPRFLEWPTDAGMPAWSPDGRFLAFSAGAATARDIHVVTLDGAPVAHVVRAGRDLAPAWVRRAAGW